MSGRRGRLRDFDLTVGHLPTGPLNAITDVDGVRVGHRTVVRGNAGDLPVVRTGVTAIWPHAGDIWRDRLYAATSAFNGYGVLTGNMVIDEWGLLAAPIVLTGTPHVGLAWDAVSRYMAERDADVGDVDVVIPVIGECDDGFLNDSRAFALTADDVRAALDGAAGGPVAEGCVGAGTGTKLFDFKGGIGTASRLIELGGRVYTVGVLVQTNFGNRDQLSVLGTPVGRIIDDLLPAYAKEGSCIAVVATDLPLHPRQLKRLARRVDIGLGRTGSVGNDGSGEIFMAFSTAQRIPRDARGGIVNVDVVAEGQFWTQGSPLDTVFDAVAEASEEAVLNALFSATTQDGRDEHVLHALPLDRVLPLLRR